jgi:hypothetical protein
MIDIKNMSTEKINSMIKYYNLLLSKNDFKNRHMDELSEPIERDDIVNIYHEIRIEKKIMKRLDKKNLLNKLNQIEKELDKIKIEDTKDIYNKDKTIIQCYSEE